jgi:hypothetical protein
MLRRLRRSWPLALIIFLCCASLVAVAADCKYVGSAKSDKYHYPTCRWARKIKPQNLVCFGSAAEALGKGYVPCKVCRPPLPD